MGYDSSDCQLLGGFLAYFIQGLLGFAAVGYAAPKDFSVTD